MIFLAAVMIVLAVLCTVLAVYCAWIASLPMGRDYGARRLAAACTGVAVLLWALAIGLTVSLEGAVWRA